MQRSQVWPAAIGNCRFAVRKSARVPARCGALALRFRERRSVEPVSARLNELLITYKPLQRECFSLPDSTCDGLIYRLGIWSQEGCGNVGPQVELEFGFVGLTTIL